MGLRYPSDLSFLSGCSRFFRWWPGGGGDFISGDNSVFWREGYILKLVFSHDEVLSCILQNALNCSLK